MRAHPHLLETNARILVERLSKRYGRSLTIGTVPEEEWRDVARRGFDLIWLMGAWQRSPGARQVALEHPGLRLAYDRVLPGCTDEDVAGSPYAIHSYTLDPALGRHEELAEVKSRLNRLGVGLVLDFVPNHLALDHPWVFAYPGRFVRGKEEQVQKHPDWFFSPKQGVQVAHGKDPYFPPWTDTAQVNFFSEDMRRAMIGELLRIAEVGDGVRCDMAMLALNDVFRQVWGWVVRNIPEPAEEFWTEAIRAVRRVHPDFLFLAEAYWGLEPRLLELGFDFAYDKTLYDRLRDSSAVEVRRYLKDVESLSGGAARFIENHDEQRAITVFGQARARAAAVVSATLPGLRFFHDGQLEGRRVHLPIQLSREPSEPTDAGVAGFYKRLLSACGKEVFHEGEWRLLETAPASVVDGRHRNLLAWSWQRSNELAIVVVNYSPETAEGRLKIPAPHEGAKELRFLDELTGGVSVLTEGESSRGELCVGLEPWCSRIYVKMDRPGTGPG